MQIYVPGAGEHISETCKALAEMAAGTDEPVKAEFNGMEIVARPGETAGDLQGRWDEEQLRKHAEYVESPEYKQRQEKAEGEHAERKAALQSALATAPPMQFSNESGWRDTAAKNTDAYGGRVVRYAEEWARLMQARMASGETIEACAEETSRLADDDGITGFMYGCAVSMLAAFWKHGEQLRRWHNLKTQIGTEGEKANASGGVLNPALLTIGK